MKVSTRPKFRFRDQAEPRKCRRDQSSDLVLMIFIVGCRFEGIDRETRYFINNQYRNTLFLNFGSVSISVNNMLFYFVRSQWRARRAPARALLFFYFCLYFCLYFCFYFGFYFCLYFFARFPWVVPRNMAPHLATGDGVMDIHAYCFTLIRTEIQVR